MTLGLKLELDVYIIDEGARWEGSALSWTISCLHFFKQIWLVEMQFLWTQSSPVDSAWL